jgi:hypothetical protein
MTALARLLLRNNSASAVRLHLEPWGEQYHFEPGATVDVVARGPEGGVLEIESSDRAITVYGWPGSEVEFHKDGVRLTGSGTISRDAPSG